jgi:hypothetical protein
VAAQACHGNKHRKVFSGEQHQIISAEEMKLPTINGESTGNGNDSNTDK